MFWSDRRQKRKQKLARIQELQKWIAEVWKAETRNVKTSEDWQEAHQIASSLMVYEKNELDYLLQENLLNRALRLGLRIPNEYYDDWQDSGIKRVLTDEGVTWANREIRKMRLAEFKAWTEIIVPILSLLVALAAILRK
jgi:hypothetical protein